MNRIYMQFLEDNMGKVLIDIQANPQEDIAVVGGDTVFYIISPERYNELTRDGQAQELDE